MKTYVFRLRPEQDLKSELIHFTKQHHIEAGCILSCVGSLKKAIIRMADARIIKEFNEDFEIVSLVGTLAQEDVHMHISISNKEGKVIGGHLKEGCIIKTTAEIIVGELERFKFAREFDSATGYQELVVTEIIKNN